MAVGTLVFGRSSYETVLCLGHILAEDGRKMSKHLGNVLEPIPLMDRHGADALRWFMLCGGSPWSARRIGHGQLEEIVRKVLLTYWNTASFLTLYAERRGLVAGRRGTGRRAAGRCWTGGRCPSCTARWSRWTSRWRASTPPGPGGGSPASSTTCPTGTSGGPAGASGTATRPRWPPCTSASRC